MTGNKDPAVWKPMSVSQQRLSYKWLYFWSELTERKEFGWAIETLVGIVRGGGTVCFNGFLLFIFSFS